VLIMERGTRFVVVILLVAIAVFASDKPVRIDAAVASEHLLHKVEPTVPPLAKSLQIGGDVSLDVTVSPDGRVISVKVLSGHPMLAPAFADAVRKWEYRPFIVNGQAVEAVTRVEWSVPSPKFTTSEQAGLKNYYPAFDRCYRLVRERNSVDAEKVCSKAVKLSDDLPQDRDLERSSARTFLAHALFEQHRIEEAIPLYEKAIEFSSRHEGSERDADFASDYANLARAYFVAGELEKADPLYSRSVVIFKAAIAALPSMQANYTSRLQSTLLEYAKLKAAKGDSVGAADLEHQAEALKAEKP
jgi:TonB family protein